LKVLFRMTQSTPRDETQDIIDALRAIQDNPELKAEAEVRPESVLDRLGLLGVARQAVAFGIIAAAIGVEASQQTVDFWTGSSVTV
jgi:hypothetical protein